MSLFTLRKSKKCTQSFKSCSHFTRTLVFSLFSSALCVSLFLTLRFKNGWNRVFYEGFLSFGTFSGLKLAAFKMQDAQGTCLSGLPPHSTKFINPNAALLFILRKANHLNFGISGFSGLTANTRSCTTSHFDGLQKFTSYHA